MIGQGKICSGPGHDSMKNLAGRLKPTPMPRALNPMLCTLVDEPFDDPAWIFEHKFDGLRVLAWFDGNRVELLSRNQKSQTFQFPDVASALGQSLRQPAVVDGEVICVDERGHSSFRRWQQRLHLTRAADVEFRMKRFPAHFCLFDVLYLDKYTVTSLPLFERKALLRDALDWSDRIRWTESQTGDGIALWREACRESREGIVGKKLNSPYVPRRSEWWVKIKCITAQKFVVAGFTEPQGSRLGLGAILVGYFSDDGRRLIYAGKVGTGFSDQVLHALRERLGGLEQRTSPFDEGTPPQGPRVHWVRPELVAEIAFGEWSQHGHLRHPRFIGLRDDKKTHECRREKAKHPIEVQAKASRTTSPEVLPNSNGKRAIHAATREGKMALKEYKLKRDFRKTREPKPQRGKPHRRPIFVVQEHHARRLHYDFRLEADGVLKSWAVPKGPSLDPSEKRLAVHVEDHPLDYAKFEGTIPEGQYGAGTVTIWDHGTYENLLEHTRPSQTVSEAIEAGKLEFVLRGRRLRGRFALVRLRGRGAGKDNWIFIKMRDEFARAGNTRDRGEPVSEHDRTAATRARARTKRERLRAGAAAASVAAKPPKRFNFTNVTKVLFPDAGIVKADVIEFYLEIADWLLPYLRDRPATLERLPEGIDHASKPHFWQKNTPKYDPDWIPRVTLTGERGKSVDYALVNNVETLAYLVNQGTLTFHVFFSRVQQLERPDFVLFDLDPSQARFGDVIAIAKELHRVLSGDGVESFVKTSGKRGLHVLVPWNETGGYDAARAWAMAIAKRVVSTMPEIATVERSKAKRGGRVYVDVMQNALKLHAVPPYVIRAVPTASVSTPLHWNELTAKLDPHKFNLKTVRQRLKRLKKDPIAGLLKGDES